MRTYLMYAEYMEITATNFRKDLFHVLDLAVRGESVEITYKGVKLQLVSASGSKLSRAVRRPTLLVEPGSIVESDAELMTSLRKTWEKDDKTL